MPLWHCKECHHEWEAHEEHECDWCHGGCYILQEKTSLERMLADLETANKYQWACHGCDDPDVGIIDPCRLYCGDDLDPLWCPLEGDTRASWRRVV